MQNIKDRDVKKLTIRIKSTSCDLLMVDLVTRAIGNNPTLLSVLFKNLSNKSLQERNIAFYQVAKTIGSLAEPKMHSELWNCFAKEKKLNDLCLYLLMMPRPYALTLIKCKNIHIKPSCIAFMRELSRMSAIQDDYQTFHKNKVQFLSFGLGDIKDAFDNAKDWFTDTLDDATSYFVGLIEEGLGTITEIMKEIVNESFDCIKECIRAFMIAGNTVVDILSNAAYYGVAFLNQTIKAIIEINDKISEILIWAANQIPYVGDVLVALLESNKLLTDILAESLIVSLELLKEMIKAAINVYQGLSNFLYQVANTSIETLRSIMIALIESGHDIADILLNMSVDVITDIMKGRLLQALLDIGYAIKDILSVALSMGLACLCAIVIGFIALWGGRPLSTDELEESKLVFGSWDNLEKVLIAFDTLPTEFCEWIDQQRPFTAFYVISFPDDNYYDFPTLIHELIHVWQNYCQDGALYIVDSIEHQLQQGQQAYDYNPDTDLIANAANWEDFNVEQQAEIIEDYYRLRFYELRPKEEYEKYLPYAQKVYQPPPDFSVLETIAELRRNKRDRMTVERLEHEFQYRLNAWFRFRQMKVPHITIPGHGFPSGLPGGGIPDPRPHIDDLKNPHPKRVVKGTG